MSDWQEFKADAGRFFDKATKEAINLGDTAALRIRIKSTELRLDEEYSKLGRLCYKKLRLEADNAADLAGVNLGDFLALVGVHLEQTADALALALRGVEHVAARADVAGVDADEAQLADERVGHDLECKCGERLFIRRVSYYLIAF